MFEVRNSTAHHTSALRRPATLSWLSEGGCSSPPVMKSTGGNRRAVVHRLLAGDTAEVEFARCSGGVSGARRADAAVVEGNAAARWCPADASPRVHHARWVPRPSTCVSTKVWVSILPHRAPCVGEGPKRLWKGRQDVPDVPGQPNAHRVPNGVRAPSLS